MDIPRQIEAIIAERKKLLPKIGEALERVERAGRAVEALEAFRASGASLPPEGMEKLTGISTKPFYEAQGDAVRQLKRLQKRFSREEVHIGFVGRAGQGKSLILQRISGLGGDIIPSADGTDCTGARSVIANRPGGQTQAQITFYTETEYIAIVNRYLKAIAPSLDCQVHSLAEVSRFDTGRLHIRFDQVEETALLEHLEKYIAHTAELQAWLGRCVTVPQEEIEAYVAQYSSRDVEKKYYTYLGVKEARIFSAFPCAQCGRLVLVDTVGTGATSLGVEDAMLETVREESDAVVLMLRPDPLRPRVAREDYELVQKIADTVSPEYARQMLFWLLNRVETEKGGNAAMIPRLIADLRGKELPVARYLDVNCWEQAEVEEKLLIPVLEQMSRNLAAIDRMILARANAQMQKLERAYRAISSQVERAMGASINLDERRELDAKINGSGGVIARMTNQLRMLYIQRGPQCNGGKFPPCAALRQAVEEKLRGILLCVPSEEDILRGLRDGTLKRDNVLEALTDQLRLQIINDFLQLNTTLREVVMEMKQEAVQALAGEEMGRLQYIVGTGTHDPQQWLAALRAKLEEAGQYPLIVQAVQALENFELKMEDSLIYGVRCCLDAIDWNVRTPKPAVSKDYPAVEEMAREIQDILMDALERVHTNVARQLADFQAFPSRAMYAVLWDFYDRAAFARRYDGDRQTEKDVKTEWRYLYEDHIPLIWKEEHDRYVVQAGQAGEWRSLTEQVHACAADGYFQIDTGKEQP